MKLTSFYTGGLLAVSCCFLAPSYSFGALAYNFPSNLPGNYSTGLESLGSVFTVNEPITVNKIGVFDNLDNARFEDVIRVAIYEVQMSGSTITSGTYVGGSQRTFSSTQTFDAGDAADGSTRTKTYTTPLTLAQGTYMVVATATRGDDFFYNRNSTPSASVEPSVGNTAGVSYGGSYFTDGTGYDWSANSTLPGSWLPHQGNADWTPAYAAGNFDFTPVPEPVHFAMAGVGMLGLVYIGRGLWMRRKTA